MGCKFLTGLADTHGIEKVYRVGMDALGYPVNLITTYKEAAIVSAALQRDET